MARDLLSRVKEVDSRGSLVLECSNRWSKISCKNGLIMKQTKILLLGAAALAFGLSAPMFAVATTITQVKQDTITFALSLQSETNITTAHASSSNPGSWTNLPINYHTITKKLTDADVIQQIGAVLGITNFSSQVRLVLVQGELSGFFNVVPGLSSSVPETNSLGVGELTGTNSTDSVPTDSEYTGTNTAIRGDTTTFLALANGRNYQLNPTNGAYPVGHFQPWGQIYIQDPAYVYTNGLVTNRYSADNPFCTNVTYFFNLTVQECYDCYYMNSFVSDAAFTVDKTPGIQTGPTNYSVLMTNSLTGHGTDRYYLTLSFDDTQMNPYLNPGNTNTLESGPVYTGHTGIAPSFGIYGTVPDAEPYTNQLPTKLGTNGFYECRFTLNGIVDYSWNLQHFNQADLVRDFIGNATYNAYGYGFVQNVCQLITGSATISEQLVDSRTCCLDIPWYDSWYGIGWDGSASGVVNEGGVRTTQENTTLSLTFHAPDWKDGVQY